MSKPTLGTVDMGLGETLFYDEDRYEGTFYAIAGGGFVSGGVELPLYCSSWRNYWKIGLESEGFVSSEDESDFSGLLVTDVIRGSFTYTIGAGFKQTEEEKQFDLTPLMQVRVSWDAILDMEFTLYAEHELKETNTSFGLEWENFLGLAERWGLETNIDIATTTENETEIDGYLGLLYHLSFEELKIGLALSFVDTDSLGAGLIIVGEI